MTRTRDVRLASLRISGFKSFAEPTEISFRQGLSAFVGPNGCGKSNILEAMRWVMGENSAKRVRSAGDMEDIIFAGSDSQPPFSRAEVALTLHNEDYSPPQPSSPLARALQDKVVRVSRRIESGGVGSTFAINGREVLARDVQTLFADLGLGASASSLVAQGQVAALVDAKPLDRRQLIVEAAGVRGTYARRREAETTLEGALSALQRVEDRIRELEAQRKKLLKDSTKAKAYREFSEKIDRSNAATLYREVQQTQQKRDEAARKKNATTKLRADAAVKISQIEQEALEHNARYESARKQEIEAAALCQNLQQDMRMLESERAQYERARARLAEQRAQLQRDAADNERAVQEAEQVLSRAAEERKSHEHTERTSKPGALQAAEQRKRANTLAQQRADLQNTLVAVEQKQRDIEAEAAVLSERLTLARSRQADLARTLASESAHEQQGEAESALACQLSQLSRDLETLQGETLVRLQAQEQQLLSARSALLQEQQAKITQLQAREREAQRVWETLRAFVEQDNLLLTALKCKPEWRKALYAALGQDLLAPLETPNISAEAIHFWRTTLPTPSLPSLPEGVASLAHYVSSPRSVRRRLEQVGIAQDFGQGEALQQALKAGQRVVTSEGACWRWDGFTSSAQALKPFLQRLAALEQIDAVKKELQLCAHEAEQQEARYRTQNQNIDRKLEETRKKHAQALSEEKSCYETRANLRVQSTEMQARSARMQQLSRDLEQATSAQLESERALEELESTADLQHERGALEERKVALEEEKAKLDSGFELSARSHEEARRALAALEQQTSQWTKIKQQAEQRLSRARESLSALEQAPSEDWEQRERELGKQQGAAQQLYKRAGAALEVCQARRARGLKIRSVWQEKDLGAEKAHIRLEAQQEHLEQERERLLAECQERFTCEPPVLLARFELDESFLAQDSEEQKRRRRADLESRTRLGEVNMAAERDLDGVVKELLEIQTQSEDVHEAVKKLRDSIGRLNAEAAERIEDIYQKVSESFTNFFARLFEGGHALLRFAEPRDPISSGLEIHVTMPGKKVTALRALSGGEQTLVAIALILAVFEAHEGRFCVMDEVDAALDDENVVRFCNLIQHILRQREVRFLVVTHHRYTMSCAQNLYGVTMPEQGCSRIFPVDLATALENTRDALRDSSQDLPPLEASILQQ